MNMFGTNGRGTTTAAPSNTGSPSYGSPAPARNGAVLSSDVSIKGDVTFTNELLIDGEVEGTITSTGRLTVGTHATVIGDIQAGQITIRGSVDGNVLATERCALEAGATLNGDIQAPRLAVSEDASFIGGATIKSSARA